MGLGGVFDDGEIMAAGDGEDGVHVGGLAVQMNGEDGAGARGDGGFQLSGVQVVGAGIDVDVNGRGAGVADGGDGGVESVGDGDDLIAGADARGEQGEVQGAGAGVDADGVGDLAIGGEFFFEGGDGRAEDEVVVVENGADGGVDLLPHFAGFGLKIEQGDGFCEVHFRSSAGETGRGLQDGFKTARDAFPGEICSDEIEGGLGELAAAGVGGEQGDAGIGEGRGIVGEQDVLAVFDGEAFGADRGGDDGGAGGHGLVDFEPRAAADAEGHDRDGGVPKIGADVGDGSGDRDTGG